MKRALILVAVLAAALLTTGHAQAEHGEDEEDEGLLVSAKPYVGEAASIRGSRVPSRRAGSCSCR